MILVSDANVLIDLGYVDGLQALTQLGEVEILDVVFDECCHPSQPELHREIAAVGIRKITVLSQWAQLARPYQTGLLSFQDALCLYYAKTYQRILLTNEAPLRRYCEEQKVPVHDIHWIIHSVYEQQLVSSSILWQWRSILNHDNRRLSNIATEQRS